MFKLKSDYKATKAQSKAIDEIVEGITSGNKHQTLLGVTGSGKTFVTANVINKIQKPTLIISHNKTLAGQLYQEFKSFFPENAVEYFVSYYDYYQPESYMPATDTYIEKDADINEEIDRLRLSATASLITRKDVIVVASVSCIYNLGSPIEYQKQIVKLKTGMKLRIEDLQKRLIQLYYERSDFDFKRGTYRTRGDTVDIHPSYQNFASRIEFLGEKITSIKHFDPISGKTLKEEELKDQEALSKAGEDYLKRNMVTNNDYLIIYPAKHYVAPKDNFEKAIEEIRRDLKIQVESLEKVGKKMEAYRLSQRTNYDLEMIKEIGYCKGIENYSRYFDGREKGSPPYSLLDFFPKDYTLFIDESHITIPQVRGMYNGDQARKQTLIDYGFRLPSALDNRPLRFDEFERRMGKTVYTSATPGPWELSKGSPSKSEGLPFIELLVRPTGLVDPEITILPSEGQIKDLEARIKEKIKNKGRVLVTTLTKRMSEELSDYFLTKGMKVAYLHSDIVTLERSDILDNLRKGEYDVLIGINLLREGLDLPEVSLVAILDADKEGFLRSETSLIQTMGRAARHIQGEVVMYADKTTGSMERAIAEVARRRKIQIEYNKENDITPTSISKPIRERIMEKTELKDETSKIDMLNLEQYEFNTSTKPRQIAIIKSLEQKMKSAAELLEFELAAKIRDKIRELKKK
ncbi:excinuclease ABC subunit B [candidate division WWE3 bacterium CG_4_9_14_0_2_um_filter_35_11]|uniref:UvrABC system protein B n=1 Tax=candidate division WWE3 bacterium CG_4_9_14_0_2_um_filter_35_11 TaxID=1975077 RepID=A0A2M8ELZ7_UNCKA|nr:MAG: excinuclease ABC subunit B [candidate division WWE3 bacterium CG10_big_fil_rev_8_21_14_0_10_35_32]PJC23758.1 MAG: excinuclease ABC subunit B [candidate division WWE3 bacterium CG_4_9_14_0_2_um_filter_35_11]